MKIVCGDGDDAQRRRARELRRRRAARNARSGARGRAGAGRGFVDVEHLLDRDVADRMGRDAPAGLVRSRRTARAARPRSNRSTPSWLGVAVVDAQRRRRAAQPAVGEELDRVDAEHVRYEALRQRQRRRRRRRRGAAASRSPATAARRSRPSRGTPSSSAGETPQSDEEVMPSDSWWRSAASDHRLVVAGRRRRHHAVDQPHRRLVKKPGRLPALVALDRRRPAGAAVPGPIPAASSARLFDGVDVAAGAREHDRTVRRRAIEVARVGGRRSRIAASL